MTVDKNKIIKNIYYMLCYAFMALKQSHYDNVLTEDFDNIQNLFAAILEKGISQQVKQGLYREYVEKTEELSVVHGKINMPETIKNKMARKQIITCDYDELSENNLLNQILKTTAAILVKSPDVKKEYKNGLKKVLIFFENVDFINPKNIPWGTIRLQRNNRTYGMLLSICQLVLDGLLMTTEKGEQKLASFVDEQTGNRLYEKFLLEYYRKEFPELSVNSSQVPWQLDDDMRDLLPVMQTDVTLTKGNKMLIIDAKYYSHTTQMKYDKYTVHSGNLYQIFTYVKNAELGFNGEHEVAGMLLYAKTEDEIQPDVTYSMSGNKISVKTLDLNCNFEDIKTQLNKIVSYYF